jgi:hypothetical protein
MEIEKERQLKMAKITTELQDSFVTLLKKYERTEDTLTAATAALAAMMVMITQRLVGEELAVECVCYAMSAAFRTLSMTKEELRKEGLPI